MTEVRYGEADCHSTCKNKFLIVYKNPKVSNVFKFSLIEAYPESNAVSVAIHTLAF
jgi:hypothetical protein